MTSLIPPSFRLPSSIIVRARQRARFRWIPSRVLVIGAQLVLGSCGLIEQAVDRSVNAVYDDPAPDITGPGDADFAQAAFVADLHADTLLWNRDLLEQGRWGHVDLGRLADGGTNLQVFAVVTRTPAPRRAPKGAKLQPEAAASRDPKCIAMDNFSPIGLLQFVQSRPVANWFSMEARALHQAERLKDAVARSEHPSRDGPRLSFVAEAEDVARLAETRPENRREIGALLALEGAHWVSEDPADARAAVDRLHDAGFRMVAPTHRFGNALAASSEGCDQLAGLTEAGTAFLKHAEAKGMIIDLAHISDRGLLEAIEVLEEPVVISHAGLRFDCPAAMAPEHHCVPIRGLTEDGVRAVAKNGGVIGMGYWPQAVGFGVARIAAAMRTAHETLSVEPFASEMAEIRPGYDPADHLALGSDFDGAVKTPFDASGLDDLVAELRRPDAQGRRYFSDEDIRKMLGMNACRVMARRLPGGSEALAEEVCVVPEPAGG
ncbi:MAG: membrane dipeptidase [Pseudomonadota bacterium]